MIFADESEKVNPALAATGGVDREATDSSLSKRKKPSEAPKPLQYFHYAYHLIPPEEGDEETQADVVTFPTAAKVRFRKALNLNVPIRNLLTIMHPGKACNIYRFFIKFIDLVPF